MILDFHTERTDVPQGLEGLLSQVAQKCVETEGVELPVFAAIRIIGDEEIHEINLHTRGVDRPTDVLSFPTVDYPAGTTARDNPKRIRREFDPEAHASFIGDILISLPRAQEQAQEYGHSLRRELCYLTAHAMFHLMGYDHMTDEDKAKMRPMEEKALEKLAPRDVEDFMSDEQLFAIACDALKNSYCPYSSYPVAAALVCEDGSVITGVNVENASYGATICAERSAICAAVSQGHRRFVKIAIVAEKGIGWPCGVCRQVLSEFALPGFTVIAGQNGHEPETMPLTELLPKSFGPNDLLIKP